MNTVVDHRNNVRQSPSDVVKNQSRASIGARDNALGATFNMSIVWILECKLISLKSSSDRTLTYKRMFHIEEPEAAYESGHSGVFITTLYRIAAVRNLSSSRRDERTIEEISMLYL